MCFASVLDSRQQKANGPKMIAHLQLPETESESEVLSPEAEARASGI